MFFFLFLVERILISPIFHAICIEHEIFPLFGIGRVTAFRDFLLLSENILSHWILIGDLFEFGIFQLLCRSKCLDWKRLTIFSSMGAFLVLSYSISLEWNLQLWEKFMN